MVKGGGSQSWVGLNEYEPRGPFLEFHKRDKRWAVMVAHRRAGKTVACVADLVIDAVFTKKQDARYAYIAPQFNQAKDIAWLYVKRLTADMVGVEYNEAELRATLPHNGAQVRLFGADNPDRLRGMYLDGVIMDEHADMKPTVWGEVVRPMLADRHGWGAFIGTPKGYNEFYKLWESAKNNDQWFTLMLRGSTSGLLDKDELLALSEEMADEQYRQEIECDFSAANVGSILGRYIEAAEKEGRIDDDVEYDQEGPGIEISSDIGFRDTATFWFWQPRPDGYALIDYDEDTGLDADDWIERLKLKPYKINRVWLPHDAKAKTFQTKRSAYERFLAARFNTQIVPQTSKADRINAARLVAPKCHWNRTKCAAGLSGLREWSFEYNEDTKIYSKEPKHDWASHPGDGFSYGAQVMREHVQVLPKGPIIPRGAVTVDQWIKMSERGGQKRARI